MVLARGGAVRVGVRNLCTIDMMQGDLGHAVAQELGYEKVRVQFGVA